MACREWFSVLKNEYLSEREKEVMRNGKAEGLEGPSENSEGEEGQLGKESQLARRVLMVAKCPLCFLKSRGDKLFKKERRKEKWKSIQL